MLTGGGRGEGETNIGDPRKDPILSLWGLSVFMWSLCDCEDSQITWWEAKGVLHQTIKQKSSDSDPKTNI